jgi:hypothetical protein
VTATFTAMPPALAQPAGTGGAAPPIGRARPARPGLRARPRVAGRARVGATLVCTRGRWSGSPSRFVLSWRRDGKLLGGGSSYRVRSVDRGHSIRCSVTAGNAVGASTAASGAVHVP